MCSQPTLCAGAGLCAKPLLDLIGDPAVGSAVAGAIPTKYRVLTLAVVAFVAQRNRQLRMQTTQPIAKDTP